ncbi:hypothetical protein [Micromonospora sp. NPDC005173]
MDAPRRRENAYYLPPELRGQEIAPEQVFGQPRPGYGTVYLRTASGD